MAKPLMKPQATSSVAGMLQRGVGAQALAKPEERLSHILPTPIVEQAAVQLIAQTKEFTKKNAEPANVLRQFSLTHNADRMLKKMISVYSEATGIDLKHSEFLRAVLVAVEHAMPELTREASLIGQLKRPKNDRSNEAIREQMERKIAKAFVAGMRAVAALDER